jgi:hypothetical protein
MERGQQELLLESNKRRKSVDELTRNAEAKANLVYEIAKERNWPIVNVNVEYEIAKEINWPINAEYKRQKRERFQEVVGEVMCAVVLMLFFGILIYAPVLFVGLYF